MRARGWSTGAPLRRRFYQIELRPYDWWKFTTQDNGGSRRHQARRRSRLAQEPLRRRAPLPRRRAAQHRSAAPRGCGARPGRAWPRVAGRARWAALVPPPVPSAPARLVPLGRVGGHTRRPCIPETTRSAWPVGLARCGTETCHLTQTRGSRDQDENCCNGLHHWCGRTTAGWNSPRDTPPPTSTGWRLEPSRGTLTGRDPFRRVRFGYGRCGEIRARVGVFVTISRAISADVACGALRSAPLSHQRVGVRVLPRELAPPTYQRVTSKTSAQGELRRRFIAVSSLGQRQRIDPPIRVEG
jgi:hypothetical protein